MVGVPCTMCDASPYRPRVRASILAAAENCDALITMLPNGEALLEVASEIIPVMQKSACFIDCSTVDIATAKMVSEMTAAAGLRGRGAGGSRKRSRGILRQIEHLCGQVDRLVRDEDANSAIAAMLADQVGQQALRSGVEPGEGLVKQPDGAGA